VLPLLGVVSSPNISDRFHLGVGSKTLPRYFQIFSHERSRILVHRGNGDSAAILCTFRNETVRPARDRVPGDKVTESVCGGETVTDVLRVPRSTEEQRGTTSS
jgi:hypothetical protein